jgi:hypothetical protein
VNLNLFMAALWAVVGYTILVAWPNADDNPAIGISLAYRYRLGGFACVLAVWNIVRCIVRLVVRWRRGRLQREAYEESRKHRAMLRSIRKYEPPNPDFDFSDPKTGGGPDNSEPGV